MENHVGRHAALRWAKSSYSSGHAQCVETAVVAGGRLVRDSKLGDSSPVLAVSAGEWSSFTAKLKSGGLDQA